MKFAPVMPAAWMPKVDWGKYHLINAFCIQDKDEEVVEWLKDRGAAHPLHYTILDNGAFELGHGQTTHVLDVAEWIHPDEIVCPDDRGEKDKTVDLMRVHYDACLRLAPYVMLVPQGMDIVEWFDCLLVMLELAKWDFDHITVGVPSRMFGAWDDRVPVLAHLQEIMPLERVHLLGTSDKRDAFRELMLVKKLFPSVRGTDTSWPVAAAMKGELCNATGKGIKYAIEDWNLPLTHAASVVASINIDLCRHLLADRG